jgi:hypothetical protein
LGTLGDPADLIFLWQVTIQGAAVGSAAPFHFWFFIFLPFIFLPFIAALRKRNNVTPVGLMSDQAPLVSEPVDQKETSQFSKAIGKKQFGGNRCPSSSG